MAAVFAVFYGYEHVHLFDKISELSLQTLLVLAQRLAEVIVLDVPATLAYDVDMRVAKDIVARLLVRHIDLDDEPLVFEHI
jgi:hypothetical protein